MKIRYFLGVAIILIAITAGYTFYITSEHYTLQNTLLYDFTLTLPIALWIILPACLLLVVACLFVFIGAFVQQVRNMRLHRDLDKIISQIQEQALGNPVRERSFALGELKTLSRILARFHLLPNLQSNLSGHEKIDLDLEAFNEIKNGIESTKIRLDSKHPFYQYNIKNSIHNDAQKSLEILKQDLNEEIFALQFYKDCNKQMVYNKAWEVICNSNSKLVHKALKLEQTHLTFITLKQLFQACVQGKIDIPQELLVQSCKSVILSEREYLAIAIEVCKLLNENNISFWLNVFEQLSKEVENSVFAYFYILLEVGKTSEAMELKQQYPKNDFLPVSAFTQLKEKGYPLLVFFDPLLYRSEKAKYEGNSKLQPKISN